MKKNTSFFIYSIGKKLKNSVFALILLSNFSKSFAQITFEKGYFISNNNETVNCFIKNIDWRNNPKNFQYKLTLDSEEQTNSIQAVREFGINNSSKYIRKTVDIDKSGLTQSNNINKLSDQRVPIFETETVFLKVVLEGDANLYEYVSKNLARYFYSTQVTEISQLIYKEYRLGIETYIRKNEQFKQQLFKHLKCKNISLRNVENLKYTKKQLVTFFNKYNNCKSNSSYSAPVQERKTFSLSLNLGINNASLGISNKSRVNEFNVSFPNQTNLRLGLDLEYTLPFNKNKFALFITPTFQKMDLHNEKEVSWVSGGSLQTSIKYNFIEVPLGLRFSFFLNEKSKIFIDTSYNLYYTLEGETIFTRSDDSVFDSFEFKSQKNATFAIGYQYKEYSVKLGIQTSRNFFGGLQFWESSYSPVNVTLGYTLF